MSGCTEEYELVTINTSGEFAALKALIKQFQSGEVEQDEFWQNLDEFVVKDELSRTEHRHIFWAAHSRERKMELRELCPYFNPHDELWRRISANAPGSPTADEQVGSRLRLALNILRMKKSIASMQRLLSRAKVGLSITATLTAALMVAAIYAGYLHDYTSSGILCEWEMFFLGLSLYSGALCSYFSDCVKSMHGECEKLRGRLLYPV